MIVTSLINIRCTEAPSSSKFLALNMEICGSLFPENFISCTSTHLGPKYHKIPFHMVERDHLKVIRSSTVISPLELVYHLLVYKLLVNFDR